MHYKLTDYTCSISKLFFQPLVLVILLFLLGHTPWQPPRASMPFSDLSFFVPQVSPLPCTLSFFIIPLSNLFTFTLMHCLFISSLSLFFSSLPSILSLTMFTLNNNVPTTVALPLPLLSHEFNIIQIPHAFLLQCMNYPPFYSHVSTFP